MVGVLRKAVQVIEPEELPLVLTLSCIVCGKRFKCARSYYLRGVRACSMACRTQRLTRRAWARVRCQWCGKFFEKRLSAIKRAKNGRHFCTTEHFRAWQAEHRLPPEHHRARRAEYQYQRWHDPEDDYAERGRANKRRRYARQKATSAGAVSDES